MSFSPSTRLTEQIADHLGGQIISGELPPLSRIPEVRIARSLGVSRGSVREALLILESRRLIDILPRRGAVVCALESDQVEPLCRLSAELTAYYFRRLAVAIDGQPERIEALDIALNNIAAAIDSGDIREFVNAKMNFVQAGYTLLNDPFVQSSLESLLPVGARLSHLVASHPDHDPQDAVRLGRALRCAMLDAGDAGERRINELVQAYYRRLQELALDCLNPMPIERRRRA